LKRKADLGLRRGAGRPPVLTEENVTSIRRQYATGQKSYADLGKIYGVSRAAISHIVTRKSWQHVA